MKEEKNSMKNNSNGLLIFIAVLLVILIAMGGFMIYTQYQNYSNDVLENDGSHENIIEQTKDSVRSLTKEEQSILLEKINNYNEVLSLNYPIKNIADMANSHILNFAFMMIDDGVPNKISAAQIENIVYTYFDNSYKFVHENYKCPSSACLVENPVFYQYDSNSKIYTFNKEHAHGGPSTFVSNSYLVSSLYNITNNELVVDVQTLYGDYCEDICGPNFNYYSSALDSDNKTNSIYTLREEVDAVNTTFDEVYEKTKKDLPITRFTFSKNKNNEFVLLSVSVDVK